MYNAINYKVYWKRCHFQFMFNWPVCSAQLVTLHYAVSPNVNFWELLERAILYRLYALAVTQPTKPKHYRSTLYKRLM